MTPQQPPTWSRSRQTRRSGTSSAPMTNGCVPSSTRSSPAGIPVAATAVPDRCTPGGLLDQGCTGRCGSPCRSPRRSAHQTARPGSGRPREPAVAPRGQHEGAGPAALWVRPLVMANDISCHGGAMVAGAVQVCWMSTRAWRSSRSLFARSVTGRQEPGREIGRLWRAPTRTPSPTMTAPWVRGAQLLHEPRALLLRCVTCSHPQRQGLVRSEQDTPGWRASHESA